MDIVEKLNSISLPLTIITEDQAKRIISAVLRKLGGLFNQCLIRAYRVEVAEDSDILELIAILSKPDQVNNTPSRISLDEKNRKGALSWCIEKKTDFWVENISNAKEPANLINKVTGEEIGEEYTDFSFDPGSIVCVPLLTKKKFTVGVLAIQLPDSGVFTPDFIRILKDLGVGIARVLRKTYEYETTLDNSNQAVEAFLNEILYFEFPKEILEDTYRTGFIARPFNSQFDKVGEIISQCFCEKEIQARHINPDLQGGLIMGQIIAQIKDSHFCIADVSGNNPNVLLEIGIMLAEKKPLLLLREESYNEQLPFNVSGYQVHIYRIVHDKNKLEVSKPGEYYYQDFYHTIDAFIAQLRTENPNFFSAKPYKSD